MSEVVERSTYRRKLWDLHYRCGISHTSAAINAHEHRKTPIKKRSQIQAYLLHGGHTLLFAPPPAAEHSLRKDAPQTETQDNSQEQ